MQRGWRIRHGMAGLICREFSRSREVAAACGSQRRTPASLSITFGTTVRIARSHHPGCLSWTGGNQQFLWTVGDRWCPPMPVRVRSDTDPAPTERNGACTADSHPCGLGWFSTAATRPSSMIASVSESPGAAATCDARPNLAGKLGRCGPGRDRCAPLRSGHLWPGCGPVWPWKTRLATANAPSPHRRPGSGRFDPRPEVVELDAVEEGHHLDDGALPQAQVPGVGVVVR
jgi:hypothetical protein